MNIRTWPVLGVLLAVLWLFVRGVEFALDALVGQFLFGLAIGLSVAYVFRRFYPATVDIVHGLRVLPYVALYVLTFVREILVANLDVAYRTLAPGPPIYSEVILVPLRVESDAAVTVLGNSITLTPGTITLDHDPEVNALYIHVIDGRRVEQVVRPIRTWEDYALEIFDEGDPAEEARAPITGGEERDR